MLVYLVQLWNISHSQHLIINYPFKIEFWIILFIQGVFESLVDQLVNYDNFSLTTDRAMISETLYMVFLKRPCTDYRIGKAISSVCSSVGRCGLELWSFAPALLGGPVMMALVCFNPGRGNAKDLIMIMTFTPEKRLVWMNNLLEVCSSKYHSFFLHPPFNRK